MGWFDTILYPIKLAVAWIMVVIHDGLSAVGLDSEHGLAWVLSIIGLTIVIRILMIPLFFKQIKASRGMQIMQPELQALQKKYKGKTDPASRQAQQQEMMDLYKKHGTNPFSSCLPILLQMPVFFALFRVLASLPALAHGTYARDSIGPLTQAVAAEAESSTLFGASLSDTFLQTSALTPKIVALVLIVLMSTTTFITTRQLTMKNMSAAALDNPMARQQKLMMYLFPVIFLFSGVNFPIGVLIYWTTTNVWSMGQQFYTIQRHPAPGSEAEKAKIAKDNQKRVAKGLPTIEEEERQRKLEAALDEPRGQRQQPVRKQRSQRARPTGAEGDEPEPAETPEPAPHEEGALSAEERAQREYERRRQQRAKARRASKKKKRR